MRHPYIEERDGVVFGGVLEASRGNAARENAVGRGDIIVIGVLCEFLSDEGDYCTPVFVVGAVDRHTEVQSKLCH